MSLEKAKNIPRDLAKKLLESFNNLSPIDECFGNVSKFILASNQIRNYLRVMSISIEREKIAIVSERGSGRTQFAYFLSKEKNFKVVSPIELTESAGNNVIIDDAELIVQENSELDFNTSILTNSNVRGVVISPKYAKEFVKLGFRPYEYYLILDPKEALRDMIKNLLMLNIAAGELDIDDGMKINYLIKPISQILGRELSGANIKTIVKESVNILNEAKKKIELIRTVYGLRRAPKDSFVRRILNELAGEYNIGYVKLKIQEEGIEIVVNDLSLLATPDEIIDISSNYELRSKLCTPKNVLISALVFEKIKNKILKDLVVIMVEKIAERLRDFPYEEWADLGLKLWISALNIQRKYIAYDEAKRLFMIIFEGLGIPNLFESVIEALSREDVIKKGAVIKLISRDVNDILKVAKREITFRIGMNL